MTLPPQHANAPTPRASETISKQDAVNAPWHAFIAAGELARQLEREQLYMMEVGNQQNDALIALKAACVEVLLPEINKAIQAGHKMETWTPEQMQWAKAVEDTEKALTAYNKLKEEMK